MAKEYYPYTLPPCPEPPIKPEPQPCPEWSICLPFGGRLYSRDGCVYAEGGNPPADGVYGKVIIANGCIAGVEPVEGCLDNIGICTGNPITCAGITPGQTASLDGSVNGTVSDSGTCCEPSKTAGNLYELDITGLPLVRCTIQAGSGVSVSGSGTTTDPYIISASAIAVQSIYLTSENSAITVHGTGTYANPFALAHKTGLQTQHNGMTFDKYGHLVSLGEGSANAGVSAVTGGVGIDVQTDSKVGLATVSLQKPTRNKNGTYILGGFEINLDDYNRVFDITRKITLTEAVYPLGAYDVTVNALGSITDIAQSGLGANFILNWPAGGTPTQRTGTFTLRFPTALGGVLYTTGTLAFWRSINIKLDSLAATFVPTTQEPVPTALPFWNFGIFAPGQHSVAITSSTAWSASAGAVLHLFALTQPDSTAES